MNLTIFDASVSLNLLRKAYIKGDCTFLKALRFYNIFVFITYILPVTSNL